MNRICNVAAITATVAAALALTACNRNDDRTVGQKVDSAVQTVETKAHDMKADARQAGERTGDKLKDAEITTQVNAELARDKSLSALSINVDTSDGRVALPGTAPDVDSRDRATTLASAVKGVVSVDNQLTVTPKS